MELKIIHKIMKFKDNNTALRDLDVGDKIYIWYFNNTKKYGECTILTKDILNSKICFTLQRKDSDYSFFIKIPEDEESFKSKIINGELIISSTKPNLNKNYNIDI